MNPPKTEIQVTITGRCPVCGKVVTLDDGHDCPPAVRAGSFGDLGLEVGKVVEQKQAAYGDSFGKSGAVMLALYPQGIPPEKLPDALTVVRVIDKLFRIATDRDALGESPWQDVAGYALLALKRQKGEAH